MLSQRVRRCVEVLLYWWKYWVGICRGGNLGERERRVKLPDPLVALGDDSVMKWEIGVLPFWDTKGTTLSQEADSPSVP